MIDMMVTNVGLDERSGKPLVVLTDKNQIRVLPIVLAPGEPDVICLAVRDNQNIPVQNQNMLLRTLQEFGYQVADITLRRGDGLVCTAVVRLAPLSGMKRSGAPELSISATVYEALALAVRTFLPVKVPEEIVAAGSLPADAGKELEETKRFHDFIAGLNASDFDLPGTAVHPEWS